MSAGWPAAPQPLPSPVVDDHCHLDIPAAARDDAAEERSLDEALAAAAAVGVPRAVQVGYDVASSRWSVDAATAHPQLLAGVALHPNEAPRLAARGELEAAYAEIEALATHPRVRVIGETGLDTFRTGP
ncbi:MAG: TatD family hydrolase, partial [Actinomycetota bacterium]|nr:TatD family hydrolase [Actinomycetota bacterium]